MNLEHLLDRLDGFRFASPWLLALLLVLPLWAWLRGRYAPVAAVQYSSVELLKGAAGRPFFSRNRMQIFMRLSALNLMILALARPQWELGLTEKEATGINVAFNLDFSSSMKTKDLLIDQKRVSRTDAMKAVVTEFVRDRPLDRIAAVRFDESARLLSPLTLDHDWLLGQIAIQQPGDGSALGAGMIIAAEALRPARDQSAVMITITDAKADNEGPSPGEAARAVQPMGFRSYVVHLVDFASMPGKSEGSELIRSVAHLAGGEYFPVSGMAGLRDVFRRIDERERTVFREQHRKTYRELLGWFAWPAGLILLVELMMTHLVWRRLP